MALAPVESVQDHVLAVKPHGDTRPAMDFYTSAPTEEALREVEPAFQRMVDSSKMAGN